MGCFCGNPNPKSTEARYHDSKLSAIEESLGEKGMPKFDPPIPRNHDALVVQQIVSFKGERPGKNSTVQLHYAGWICEEDDLWRERGAKTLPRLATPLKNPTKEQLDTIFKFRSGDIESGFHLKSSSFSTNRLIQGSVRGGSAIGRLDTIPLGTPTARLTPTRNVTKYNSMDSILSFTDKSATVYGKCYEYTESWEVQLGVGEIVNGLEEVILSMSVGDEVKAFIPSRLAYGEEGLGQIVPPKADLVVQISLTGIL